MDNIEKMTIDTQDTGISQIKQQQTLHTTIRKKNTNNVNKTWSILQTTGRKEYRLYVEIKTDIAT